ncbi:MAG: penicillin-binding protein 1B [Gammaproteobacteria bacterium]|nr:penicillin-binding protein 1B [Gammaproteobacteria bacterium]
MTRKKKRKQAKKKTSRKSRARKSSSRSLFSSQWYLILQLFVISLLCGIAYLVWLDHRVTSEFEGKRWSLPARVYARPLELFIGANITDNELSKVLNSLAYQHMASPHGSGQYQKQANSIRLISRVFDFWDRQEPSKKIRIEFSAGRILSITDETNTEQLSVFRLEPQLIGKIYPEHNEDRVLVPYDEVPKFLVDALVAVEDRNFYRHFGIDLKGILRATISNITSGELRQGGSTLTQQLVKNYFLTRERTFNRKINEVIMAILLEQHYSKAEIMSAYINEVYLGQHGARGVHGFGTAAEYYFSRPLNELKTDEIALLVALVRGASYYNPRKHHDRALKRRNLTLTLMQQQGYLSTAESNKAIARPLRISKKPSWSSAKYPAFLDLVRRQLRDNYQSEDLRNEGLRIFTTLNTRYQDIVEQSVPKRLASLEKQKKLSAGTLQAAGVITSVETGEVLALVGGRNKASNDFNRALDAIRPIGSLVKPAVYLTALMQPEKYNSLTLIEDESVSLKQYDGTVWKPENYDKTTHGNVALHTALSKSYNLATVNLGLKLGLNKVVKTLHALGIEAEIPEYPSLLLGSLNLSPLQVTQMYQTLASGGFQVPLRTIKEVLDKDGKPLQRYGLEIKQTVESKSVFMTRHLLSEVASSGTARSIATRLPGLLPLAGKTGTTNELRDSWFAGFGDDVLGVIWLGRDDNQSSRLTGSSGALQIWIDIMQGLKPRPLSFITPEGIEWAKIIHDQRVADGCSAAVAYPFVKAYLPEISGTCQNTLIQRKRFKNIKTERKNEKDEADIRKHFNIH